MDTHGVTIMQEPDKMKTSTTLKPEETSWLEFV
jgi:hypothetical protein